MACECSGKCGAFLCGGADALLMRGGKTFRYELEPNCEAIELLDSSDFQGVSRFDLSARRACYERDNRTSALLKTVFEKAALGQT